MRQNRRGRGLAWPQKKHRTSAMHGNWMGIECNLPNGVESDSLVVCNASSSCFDGDHDDIPDGCNPSAGGGGTSTDANADDSSIPGFSEESSSLKCFGDILVCMYSSISVAVSTSFDFLCAAVVFFISALQTRWILLTSDSVPTEPNKRPDLLFDIVTESQLDRHDSLMLPHFGQDLLRDHSGLSFSTARAHEQAEDMASPDHAACRMKPHGKRSSSAFSRRAAPVSYADFTMSNTLSAPTDLPRFLINTYRSGQTIRNPEALKGAMSDRVGPASTFGSTNGYSLSRQVNFDPTKKPMSMRPSKLNPVDEVGSEL
nr:hypothetical protein Iba_chr03dCG4480 [Ipomoea batatas]